MKKIGIFIISSFLCSLNSYSQDLWASFPRNTKSNIKAIVNYNGTVTIHTKETTGFYGTEITIEQGKLIIGTGYDKDTYTFDASDFKSYNNGSSVYYIGKDKYDQEYKIYFNLKTVGGNYKAIQLVKNDISGTITYYID